MQLMRLRQIRLDGGWMEPSPSPLASTTFLAQAIVIHLLQYLDETGIVIKNTSKD